MVPPPAPAANGRPDDASSSNDNVWRMSFFMSTSRARLPGSCRGHAIVSTRMQHAGDALNAS